METISIGSEEQILDAGFRKWAIENIIESDENIDRKKEAQKRYNIYKDKTDCYVKEIYKKEQGENALQEISYRCSNVSVGKSMVNKKAILYVNGVKRTVPDEDAQKQLDVVVDELNLNSVMKKVNRYEELFKNALLQIYPYKNELTQKWRTKLNVLSPMKYDAIVDANDLETLRGVVFSSYCEHDESFYYTARGESANHPPKNVYEGSRSGLTQDKQYIWWTTKYHFTTNKIGEIIDAGEDLQNIFEVLPFINFSYDQDGEFWAKGGDDIIQGSILINVFLTDLFYIAKYQGMGLFYLFGKGVPKNIKVGPSQAITMDVKEGDPTPQIGFATSNPAIADYLDAIKEYLAFLLKTNKLRPGEFVGKDSVGEAQSGIQEVLQRSELIEDIEDKKELYRDNEPLIYYKYAKIHNFFLEKGLLEDDFASIGKIDESLKMSLNFNDAQSVMTEKEKLEIIKMRSDLNLDTRIDSIMRDNPSLTKEEAEQRLMEILEENVEQKRNAAMATMEDQNGKMQDQETDKEEMMMDA